MHFHPEYLPQAIWEVGAFAWENAVGLACIAIACFGLSLLLKNAPPLIRQFLARKSS